MTVLANLLGLADRELISLVGGGGKSTMLFSLGDELSSAGNRVILTTTTKMGRDQTVVVEKVCWSADTDCVTDSLDQPGPVMLVAGGDDHKVTGPPPEVVDCSPHRSPTTSLLKPMGHGDGRSRRLPHMSRSSLPSRRQS